MFGRAMAWIVLHGGRGMDGLAEPLIQCLSTRVSVEDVYSGAVTSSVDDIPIHELQELLRTVRFFSTSGIKIKPWTIG